MSICIGQYWNEAALFRQITASNPNGICVFMFIMMEKKDKG